MVFMLGMLSSKYKDEAVEEGDPTGSDPTGSDPVLRITYEGSSFGTGDDIDPLSGSSGITYSRAQPSGIKDKLYCGDYLGTISTVVNNFNEIDTANYTVCFWLRFVSNGGGYDTLFATSGYSSSAGRGLNFYFYNNTRFILWRSHPSWNYSASATGITLTDDWHHIVCTISGGTPNVYLDGSSVTMSSLTYNYAANQKLWIAQHPSNSSLHSDRYFDDFRVYSGILTSTQVTNLYNLEASHEGNLFFICQIVPATPLVSEDKTKTF